MPSLTSLSALFLLCLCMCPNYLCSAKELGAQTQELLCLLAMPTQGELCRGWRGHCPEGCWGCGSCGWETLLCLELTACSQALRWGFWHNTVCGSLLQLRILGCLIHPCGLVSGGTKVLVSVCAFPCGSVSILVRASWVCRARRCGHGGAGTGPFDQGKV